MHAVVFLWQPDDVIVRLLPEFELAVAADSGIETAERWGVVCDLAVGDFDSASAEALGRAEAAGVLFKRVPAEKDESDAELAISVALERDAASITVVGSSHGRTDHAMVLLQALGHPRLTGVVVDAWIDDTYVQVAHNSTVALHEDNGRTVSLVPCRSMSSGVTTSGLRWPLQHATLESGAGLSLSNEMTEATAEVTAGNDALLVMQTCLP